MNGSKTERKIVVFYSIKDVTGIKALNELSKSYMTFHTRSRFSTKLGELFSDEK